MRSSIWIGIWLTAVCTLTAACSQQKDKPVDTTLHDPEQVAAAPMPSEEALTRNPLAMPAEYEDLDGLEEMQPAEAMPMRRS